MLTAKAPCSQAAVKKVGLTRIQHNEILIFKPLYLAKGIIVSVQCKMYCTIVKNLKCPNHFSNETPFEFLGIWVTEDNEKIRTSIARATQCEVDVDALYLPD